MLNRITIMGRLTSDPQLKETSNGVPYTHFIIAVDDDYKKEKVTSFVPVTAWRSTAAFITRHFVKGKLIIIDGSLKVTSYRKDNDMRFVSNIEVSRVYFAGDKKQETESAEIGDEEKNIGNPLQEFDLAEYEELLAGEDVPF